MWEEVEGCVPGVGMCEEVEGCVRRWRGVCRGGDV